MLRTDLYLTNSATLVDAGTIVDNGLLLLGASETATDSSSLIIEAGAVFIGAGEVIEGSYQTPDTILGLTEPGSITNAGLFEGTLGIPFRFVPEGIASKVR